MFGNDRCAVGLMNKSLEYLICNYRSACTDLLQNLLFPSAWYKSGMSFLYLKDSFSCTKLHVITSWKTATLNKYVYFIILQPLNIAHSFKALLTCENTQVPKITYLVFIVK